MKFHRGYLTSSSGRGTTWNMDAQVLPAPAPQDGADIIDFEELRQKVALRKAQPISKLNDLHEALADYMLVNPGATFREMGAHFNYSVSWLCTVVNSDMFQAYFAGRRGEVSSFVAASLPKKLEAAAHLATEKMIAVLEKTEDPDLILDGFDKVMHRFGYAPSAKNGGAQAGLSQQGNIQNNFYLKQEEFQQARGHLLEQHKQSREESGQPEQLPAPAT